MLRILDRPARLRYNIGKILSAEVDVGNAADKRNIVLQTKRALLAWRVRLLSGRAAVALLLLFTLGLGEPVLCIIHCQIWLPIAFHSYFAAQHAHMHHHNLAGVTAAPAEPPVARIAGAAAIAPTASTDSPTCAFQSGSSSGSSPFYIPPSPVHDAIPALLLLLLVSLVVAAHPPPLAARPPHVFCEPPLRPPISSAV
jgi:hypothetical protein